MRRALPLGEDPSCRGDCLGDNINVVGLPSRPSEGIDTAPRERLPLQQKMSKQMSHNVCEEITASIEGSLLLIPLLPLATGCAVGLGGAPAADDGVPGKLFVRPLSRVICGKCGSSPFNRGGSLDECERCSTEDETLSKLKTAGKSYTRTETERYNRRPRLRSLSVSMAFYLLGLRQKG